MWVGVSIQETLFFLGSQPNGRLALLARLQLHRSKCSLPGELECIQRETVHRVYSTGTSLLRSIIGLARSMTCGSNHDHSAILFSLSLARARVGYRQFMARGLLLFHLLSFLVSFDFSKMWIVETDACRLLSDALQVFRSLIFWESQSPEW